MRTLTEAAELLQIFVEPFEPDAVFVRIVHGIAGFVSSDPALKILRPPEVLGKFNYLMAWHPRMNTDAGHVWLRNIIREAAKALPEPSLD